MYHVSFSYFFPSIAWGGVILPVGFASGEIPQVLRFNM